MRVGVGVGGGGYRNKTGVADLGGGGGGQPSPAAAVFGALTLCYHPTTIRHLPPHMGTGFFSGGV